MLLLSIFQIQRSYCVYGCIVSAAIVHICSIFNYCVTILPAKAKLAIRQCVDECNPFLRIPTASRTKKFPKLVQIVISKNTIVLSTAGASQEKPGCIISIKWSGVVLLFKKANTSLELIAKTRKIQLLKPKCVCVILFCCKLQPVYSGSN